MSIVSRIAAIALGAGMLLGVPTAAMASSGPQQFVTHVIMHPDTTSVSTGVVNFDGSPVWAWDNGAIKFTPVSVTPSPSNNEANYQVKIEVVGSFQGFADPTTGAALTSTGSVQGTITFDVLASGTPQRLPAQQPQGVLNNGVVTGSTSLSDMLNQLFTGGATIVGGGDYNFSYQNGNYIQDTTGSTGDVRGH
jgi:hypothetical protein